MPAANQLDLTPASDFGALTVILAVLGEAQTIERAVRRIFAAVPGAEVVVVDGGDDGTDLVVQRLMAEHARLRLVRLPDDRGKGHATQVGIAHATGRVQAQLDADLQFLPEELPRLVAPILAGEADIVLGTRFARGAVRRPGSTSGLSRLGNWVVNLYISGLCGQRLTDAQAGFKAWSREAIARVGLTSDNFSYEAEIPISGRRRGLRVRELPITTEPRTAGSSKVRYLRDGARLLRDVTWLRLRPLRGR